MYIKSHNLQCAKWSLAQTNLLVNETLSLPASVWEGNFTYKIQRGAYCTALNIAAKLFVLSHAFSNELVGIPSTSNRSHNLRSSPVGI